MNIVLIDRLVAGKGILRTLFWPLLILHLLAIGYLYVWEILYQPINTDAGFYLSMARQWAEGQVVYKDYWMRYTPFCVYLWGMWGELFSFSNYGVFVLLMAIIQLANACFVGYLAYQLGISWRIGVVCGVCMLYLALPYEGLMIELEPLGTLFVLGSCMLLFRDRPKTLMYFFAGVLAGMAVLTKQYCLAFIPPFLLALFLFSNMYKYIWAGIVGLVAPLAGFLLYYYMGYGMTPMDLSEIWMSGGGYANQSSGSIVTAIGVYLGTALPLLFIAIVGGLYLFLKTIVFERGGAKFLFDFPHLAILILAAVSFGSSLLIRQYPHYFLYLIPFTILLCAAVWQYLKRQDFLIAKLKDKRPSFVGTYKKVFLFFLIMSIGLLSIRIGRNVSKRLSMDNWERKFQYAIANELTQYVRPGSEVMLLSYWRQWLNYVNAYLPIDPSGQGYNFPENYTDEDLDKMGEKAQLVITEAYDLETYPRYIKMLEGHGFQKKAETSHGLQLWQKD